MSSGAIRGIRRKKSSLSEVKIAIIGAPGVGKSALAVRFLTRRYIGEYDHQSETRYKHEMLVDGEPVIFEIADSCPKTVNELPLTETILWADGYILVYSITDRNSFNYVKLIKQHILDVRSQQQLQQQQKEQLTAVNNNSSSLVSQQQQQHGGYGGQVSSVPMVLLGNKGDMVHLRQVATEEGDILSKDFDCYFSEVAAADQVSEVAEAFHELCREVQISRRKNKTSLLDRVLGNKSAGLRSYSRGKSDSVLSKD